MKINLPVTQQEKPFPTGRYLVSKTDLKGSITYANDAFVELSGFSREELIGKNHNIVRHPDMPPQAFEHLWATVKQGRPWQGIVKNRSKDGDHYWVDAFVVPVRENDRTVGFMSVRSEPSRAKIREAEALYAQLKQSNRKLEAKGSWRQRLSLRTRLVGVMAFMALLMTGGAIVGLAGMSLTNQDLQEAYEARLKPALAIAKMVERLGDNRSQIMLGLQHNGQNPHARMHDHPLAIHIDATLANREQIEALRAEYQKHSPIDAEERALAAAFFETRDAFSREGVAPAREALKAGDFDKANVLLLSRINPLYKEMMTRGDALLQHLYRSGEKRFQASQERFSTIRALAIGGTLVGLLLIAIAGAFLIRAIVLPLRRAIAHFDHISQNRLADEIDISGRDEAGQLMCGLASMQVHLKVMLDEIRLASTAIDGQCRQLSAEMNRVIEQSREQRDRVHNVAATTEEFTQSVSEVAGSAARTAEAAGHSRALVGESTTSMSDSMAATSRVVGAVQTSSATIDELNEAIQKIGDITNTIKEIADQTNLLALNAAIEAARAGEQGRGFAVVADEVRKLAERTASSTSDIANTVTRFREVTHQAVASMDKAVQEVEDGIGMMRNSVGGLDRIRSSSEDVADMAEHIAAAAQQQAVASADVSVNMEQISSLIDQNSSIALEAWQSVENLSGTAAGLMSMVQKFELAKASQRQ